MIKNLLSFLKQKLADEPQRAYPVQSRIHPLNKLGNHFFVKREDELGFGIAGSKIRKYRTLIPYLKSHGYREIGVLGGPFSNNVLSITQLLIEEGLKPTLFLHGRKPSRSIGNYAFLEFLVDPATIHWVGTKETGEVQKRQQEYLHNRADRYIIPEGALLFQAATGICTLPIDILRNEEEEKIVFDEIFIDSGTGLTAVMVLLVFALIQKETMVHILQLAQDEEAFFSLLKTVHAQFSSWMGFETPFPSQYTSFFPTIAPSFGATNKQLFAFIRNTAAIEGFFLDPIYSGKLFFEVQQRVQNEPHSQKKRLIIHSGGALSLSGFLPLSP